MNRFRTHFRTYKTLIPLLLVGIFFSVPLVTHAGLGDMIISIVGYILYLAAWLFNGAFEFFVLGMGGLITGKGSLGVGIGVSIDIAWKIVRDLVNLTFIFGLVYVGFKTILDAGTDTKKLLSSIIIGALLVNFSLFISKVVIDVSNVTASEIYKQMNIGPGASDERMRKLSIGEAFLTQMGIFNLVAIPNGAVMQEFTSKIAENKNAGDWSISFVVGASVFIIVAIFVFAAGALLLIIRFGVLVILMILSPIAFAATVFPVFKTWSQKWWHTLFSQSFFAPAYLFMLYVTLKVAEGYQGKTKLFENIYSGTIVGDGVTTMVFFCLTIVMMVASLILAKQMGAIGAGHVVGFGKKLSLGAGNKLRGFAGRKTIGWAAAKGAQANNYLEQKKGGRFFKGLVSAASLGTFTEQTRRAVFEKGQKAKFGGSYSRAETMEFKNRRDKATAIYNDIQKGRAVAADYEGRNAAPASGSDDEKALQALAKAIASRSTKDLEGMQVSLLSNENVAIHLTSEQIKGIENSEKFSPQDVDKIKDARKNALVAAAGRTSVRFPALPATFGDVHGPATLARRGENEVAKFPIEALVLPQMAEFITPGILEQLMKEGKADTAQMNTLKGNIEAEGRKPYRLPLPARDPYREKFNKWKGSGGRGGTSYGAGLNITF